MWDVFNKKILVIGAGRSGVAAACFLKNKGSFVTLTDAKPLDQVGEQVRALGEQGIKLVLGCEPEISPEIFDTVVISPGVPLTIPMVKKIRSKYIPLIGELEAAYRAGRVPYVAITGTNGKTTTTALTGQIFIDAGFPVFVGGNIGTPLVAGVDNLTPEHIVVAEVSSFQLETIDTFCPRAAVIINITPDHLDRHGDMEGYTAAKARIFENQKGSDFTILNYDDPRVRALADKTKGQVIFFSQNFLLDSGVRVNQGWIEINLSGDWTKVISCGDILIKGRHNLENALAATTAAACMGIKPKFIAQTLKRFPGVAHRLEYVAEVEGVVYINDSKGTNPDSTIKALEAYDRPIVLIAGGKDKGSDFTGLAKLIKEKVRTLVLVGQSVPILRKAVEGQGFTSIVEAGDFRDTVTLARKAAYPGDVVMLSPACASWDMFKDFEERGDLFKALVMDLNKE